MLIFYLITDPLPIGCWRIPVQGIPNACRTLLSGGLHVGTVDSSDSRPSRGTLS